MCNDHKCSTPLMIATWWNKPLRFQTSSRKCYHYQRPIGDRHPWSETDIPDRRPIGDPSETDMPDRRPRYASSKTHLKPTCTIGDQHTYRRYIYVIQFLLVFAGMLVSDRSTQARQSPTRHVGLRWSMSRSPMKHVEISNGSRLKHVEVLDGSPMSHVGLRWVSERSLMGLW